MAKLSVSNAWDESRAILARDGKLLTTIALALLVLPATLLGTAAPGAVAGTQPPSGGIGMAMLLVALIGLVGRLALARMALGGAVSVGAAMGDAARRTPAALAAFLLFMIPVALLLAPFLPDLLANPQAPPPTASLAVLLIVVAAFVIGVRLLSLVIPAAMAEGRGPIRLLKRSWTLTAGNWWRLIGFVLLFFVAAIVAARAVGWVLGGMLIVAAGPLDPMSVGALVLALALALVGALFTTIFTVMLTRLYVQGSTPETGASVPHSAG